jgi:hypothetical protein
VTATVQTPATRCPGCGLVLNAATNLEGANLPVPGDLSVCLGCGGMMRFTDELRVVPLEEEDFEALEVEVRRDLVLKSLAAQRVKHP